MKKALIIVAVLIGFGISSQAQSALGLRLGGYGGLTFRTTSGFLSHLEIMAALPFNDDGIYGTVLFEQQQQLGATVGLSWYYGLGGHFGTYFEEIAIGADFILGLDYIIPSSPINLSLDWKPAVDIIGGDNFRSRDGAISIRYMF